MKISPISNSNYLKKESPINNNKALPTNKKSSDVEHVDLSPDYREFLSYTSIYSDLSNRYDIENLTYTEFEKLKLELVDNDILTLEQYNWVNLDIPFQPKSNFVGEFTESEMRQMEELAAKHPDPSALYKIMNYAAYKRDQDDPISFDKVLDYLNPNKAFDWMKIISEELKLARKSDDIDSDIRKNYERTLTKIEEILKHIQYS